MDSVPVQYAYSSTTVMDDKSYLHWLPEEIFRLVLKYLSECDKISLQFAHPEMFTEYKCFVKLCRYIEKQLMLTMIFRQINVRDIFAYNGENMERVLQLHPNPKVVTKLDFNFVTGSQANNCLTLRSYVRI